MTKWSDAAVEVALDAYRGMPVAHDPHFDWRDYLLQVRGTLAADEARKNMRAALTAAAQAEKEVAAESFIREAAKWR